MSDDLAKLFEDVARTWSSVPLPNPVGVQMALPLQDTITGLAAEHGRMAFEEEPSSFDAALQATKETGS
ncbi:MAG: hypothetical protein CML68_12745 [Rhodobacteraceae bacterium]|nr:hypothetical protein [Paracoccaceae bacterium]